MERQRSAIKTDPSSLLRQNDFDLIEAGCDEAGRGCLAGPVFAAAVILPPDFKHPYLNDSKQLNEKQRTALRSIIEKESIWAVAQCSVAEIDELNILNASITAMHRALKQLNPQPEAIIVDGNRFKIYQQIPFTCMIKGDARFQNIAAASVLAKTHRDAYMLALSETFPIYEWQQNKGYPTAKHRNAILAQGATIHHRTTFKVSAATLKSSL